jgi:hypothetical protein
MVTVAPHILDWPPSIASEGLPEEEHEAALQVTTALRAMMFYQHDFRAALALFDFSRAEIERTRGTDDLDRSFVSEWTFLAGRDGAMSIFHFGKSIKIINNALGKCPTVRRLMDESELKRGRKLMQQLFPNFESVRHSIAHSAELMKDTSRHVVTGPYEKGNLRIESGAVMFGRNCFIGDGRTFFNTFEGEIQTYDLSPATLDGLQSVRTAFNAAFYNASQQTLAMAIAAQKAAEGQ